MAKIGNVVDAETAFRFANFFSAGECNFRSVIWPETKLPETARIQERMKSPQRELVHLICRDDFISAVCCRPMITNHTGSDLFTVRVLLASLDYEYGSGPDPVFEIFEDYIISETQNEAEAVAKTCHLPKDFPSTTIRKTACAYDISKKENETLTVLLMRAVWLEDFAFSPLSTTKLKPTRRHLNNPVDYPKQYAPIEIINLRLPEKIDHPESTGKSINLRFPVTGFIRRQWYPSLGIHKPIPIAPHWRGPEDAPVKPHTERVYKVTR